MKTNTLHISAFSIAVAALVVSPLSPFAACLAVTLAGVISILSLDYGRNIMPITVPADVIPFNDGNRTSDASVEAA